MSANGRARSRLQATSWDVDRAGGIITHVQLGVVYRAEPHRLAELERMRDSGAPNWPAAVADAAARFWPPERAARVSDCAAAGMCWLPDPAPVDRRAPGSVAADHPNAHDVAAWSLWVRAATLEPVVRMWADQPHGQAQAAAMEAAQAKRAGAAWVRVCVLDRERPR